MSDYGGPQPGWYADPHNSWQYRYWDGRAWTQHVAPTGAAAPAGAGNAVPPLPFPAVRAEFGRRALGYIVDGLVIGLPTIILFIVVIVAFFASVDTTTSTATSSSDSTFFRSSSNSGASLVFVLVLIGVEAMAFLLPLLYNGYFTGGGRRTVGQRVAGLRVVDVNTGQPLTLGKSFLRALVAGVASGQIFGLGYWWALWDREHRTWHDMAASSVVVDVRHAG